MKIRRLVALGLALSALVSFARAGDTVFLFTYFVGNGEDGLHLAWSEDGYKWTALKGGKSYLTPQIGKKEKLMRDPSVVRGPDGVFHLVWTSGWHENNFGHASTRDFLTWSEQQEVPVMAGEPAAQNTWAPEVIWDPVRAEYLIFWATTIPGRFPETEGASESKLNHRLYATTTKDWKIFTPTRLFSDPGFSVIDATFLPGTGRPVLIVKDETVNPPKKHLRLARGETVAGPWKEFAAPFTRDWVEGPTAIRVGGAWLVYYDVYREHHYGAVRSHDLKTWEDVTTAISIPKGARHGTMIEVPRAVVEKLISAETAAKQP